MKSLYCFKSTDAPNVRKDGSGESLRFISEFILENFHVKQVSLI